MQTQNPSPESLDRLLPQDHFPLALPMRENPANQTGYLGLFRKPPSPSISLISRTLPWESSSPTGPKRPTFSHAAFLPKAPPPRTAVHCILSSLRPLRSLRFLLRLARSAQNRWRAGTRPCQLWFEAQVPNHSNTSTSAAKGSLTAPHTASVHCCGKEPLSNASV